MIIQWHSCCSPGWCRRRGTYPGPSSRSVGECGWREWVGAAGARKGCEAASPTPARGLDITWPGGGLHPRPRPVVGPTQPPVCTSPGQPRYSWPRSSLQWTSDRQLTVRTLHYDTFQCPVILSETAPVTQWVVPPWCPAWRSCSLHPYTIGEYHCLFFSSQNVIENYYLKSGIVTIILTVGNDIHNSMDETFVDNLSGHCLLQINEDILCQYSIWVCCLFVAHSIIKRKYCP